MRLFCIALLTLSFNVFAANPPMESHARMNETFPGPTFLSPDERPAKLSDYEGKVALVKL
jgi:hypothetical protein